MKTKSVIFSVLFTLIFGANVFSQTTKTLEQTVEDCVEEVMKHHKCIDECTEKMHVFKDGLTLECPAIDAAFANLSKDLEKVQQSIEAINLDELMEKINVHIQEVNEIIRKANDDINKCLEGK